MKKKATAPKTKNELTAAESRLLRKTEKEYSKIKSKEGKKHYENNVFAMKNKSKQYVMMFALTRINKIRAKLGMSDQEHLYLEESVIMHQAQVDDVSDFFDIPFDGLTRWNTENEAAAQALLDVANELPGAEGQKQTAFSDLAITLELALAYVNALCARNQRQAVDIILSARMKQVLKGEKNKQELTVQVGAAAGTAKLMALVPTEDAKKLKCTFFWCYSYDRGDTWSLYEIPPTHQASTIARGLTSGASVIFRKRQLTKNGFSDWVVSKPITIL